MYPILVHLHSGFRWILLVTLVLAIIQTAGKLSGNHSFTDKDKKMPLFAFISCHIQLLVGLILYAISPKVVFSDESMKNAMSRFFLVEHTSMMILAIIIISVGYIMAKKVIRLTEQDLVSILKNILNTCYTVFYVENHFSKIWNHLSKIMI